MDKEPKDLTKRKNCKLKEIFVFCNHYVNASSELPDEFVSDEEIPTVEKHPGNRTDDKYRDNADEDECKIDLSLDATVRSDMGISEKNEENINLIKNY